MESLNGIENQIGKGANQVYSAPYKDIIVQVPEGTTKQQILTELHKINLGRSTDYIQQKYRGVFAVFVNPLGLVLESGYVIDLAKSGKKR